MGMRPRRSIRTLASSLSTQIDVVARLGQACSDDQTDIPGPDNGNLHPALGSP